MAKKSKSSKKHNFKYSQPITNATEESKVRGVDKTNIGGDEAILSTEEYAYVKRDLKTLGLLVTVLLVLEIGLWAAFNNTGLGEAIYTLLKV